MTTIADISIGRAERGLLVGGTGSGKTTIAELMIAHCRRTISELRVLVVDTKPRFRAEWQLDGLSAAPLYRRWDHGEVLPGSYLLDLHVRGYGLESVWQRGGRVAVAQSDSEESEYPEITRVVEAFYRGARASEPRMLYVDEVMDFYGMTGQPIAGSRPSIVKCVRAGREKGLGVLVATQRPQGIPVQLVQEASVICVFRLDNEDDLVVLMRRGLPRSAIVPEEDRVFWWWRKPRRTGKLLTVKLPG